MKPKRTKSIVGMILGVGLMIYAPLIGLFGTTMGMTQAFKSMGKSSVGNPDELAHHIGTALNSTAIGVGCGLGGLLILIVSIVCFIVAGSAGREDGTLSRQ